MLASFEQTLKDRESIGISFVSKNLFNKHGSHSAIRADFQWAVQLQ